MYTYIGNAPGERWVAVSPHSGCARGNSVQWWHIVLHHCQQWVVLWTTLTKSH